MPTTQTQLIGDHPVAPHIFGLWLTHRDTPVTDKKKHRQLEENVAVRSQAIEQLAQWIVEYHVTNHNKDVIDKAKALLDKHGLSDYVDKLHVLPHSENTQKGNLGEIMLIEYIKASRGFTPLIYKLHYNPNVEQSMKGDDALLFNTTNIMSEVICGEGKFRKTPSTKVLREIIDNLQGYEKFPASISFVANRLAEIGQKELAGQITELQMAVFNGTVPVTNVGFFISKSSRCKDSGTSALVEKNLDSTNPRLVMLSLGVDNPVEIVTKAFQRAEEILKTK